MRAAGLAALALLAAGCVQAPESEAAKRAVAEQADGERDVQCTSRSLRWFREGPAAEVFLCVARREHGRCDRYRVRRDGDRFLVRRTDGGTTDCALPPG